MFIFYFSYTNTFTASIFVLIFILILNLQNKHIGYGFIYDENRLRVHLPSNKSLCYF